MQLLFNGIYNVRKEKESSGELILVIFRLIVIGMNILLPTALLHVLSSPAD